ERVLVAWLLVEAFIDIIKHMAGGLRYLDGFRLAFARATPDQGDLDMVLLSVPAGPVVPLLFPAALLRGFEFHAVLQIDCTGYGAATATFRSRSQALLRTNTLD